MTPFDEAGPAVGLLLGILAGLALEGAGLGCPRKLAGQFALRDFTLFRIAVTAILVAGAGLWYLEPAGISGAAGAAAALWAVTLGGALIGAGVALGGYCPVTAAVGLGSGRIDAVAFLAGLIVGVDLFGVALGWSGLAVGPAGTAAGTGLDALLGVSAGSVLIALAVVAALGFLWGGWMEQQRAGPMTANWLLP